MNLECQELWWWFTRFLVIRESSAWTSSFTNIARVTWIFVMISRFSLSCCRQCSHHHNSHHHQHHLQMKLHTYSNYFESKLIKFTVCFKHINMSQKCDDQICRFSLHFFLQFNSIKSTILRKLQPLELCGEISSLVFFSCWALGLVPPALKKLCTCAIFWVVGEGGWSYFWEGWNGFKAGGFI